MREADLVATCTSTLTDCEPSHELSVVESFSDIRQVIEHDYRLIEGLSVLDGLARDLLDDICERILVVVKSLVNPPLGGVMFL